MPKTKNFAEVLRRQLASDPKLRAEVEKHRLNFSIAALIFDERKKAGLTQKQLAERIGTHQSVIARLEDADYDGHSLSMLWRIADALGAELRLEFARPPVNSTITVTFDAMGLESGRVEVSFSADDSSPLTAASSAHGIEMGATA